MTPVRPLPPALPASSGNSYSIPSTSVVCLFYKLSQNSCKFNVIYHKIHFVQLGQPTNQSRNVTVVVENPMTVDDKGKLVSMLCCLLTPLHLFCPSEVKVANFYLFVYAGEQCCSRGYKWWEKVAYHNLCNFVYYV